MANLDKEIYNLTYHLGTTVLSGDTEISLRRNYTGIEYEFRTLATAISFNPDTTSDAFALIDIIFNPAGVTAGAYSYNCEAYNPSDSLNFTVNLTVIGADDPDPEEPTDPEEDPFNPQSYETKYIIENININGDEIKLEVLQNKGEEPITPISVRGTIAHEYAERKDLLQPIIASSLKIDLEASEDFTLIDLYTEEESKYKIRLSRNEQVIFFGILKPDGIWENFTTSRWVIEMDAMDGLSILKDLSFVKDPPTHGEAGAPYEGDITQFEALKQCLHRIGYDLPINVSTDLPMYLGFAGDDTVLKAVIMNADRFYQDAEKDQIMDCEEVLKSILEPYNATIIQMHGEWWIYRTLDVKDIMNFYRYYGNEKTDIVWEPSIEIGSHINNYEIIHANANQKKSISPSTQAFRVNYKYGTVRELYRNPYLRLDNGIDADGWFINDINGKVTPQDDGTGVKVWGDIDQGDIEFISNMYLIRVTKDDRIDAVFNFSFSPLTLNNVLAFTFETDNYIMTEEGWVFKSGNAGARLVKAYGPQDINVTQTFNIPSIPEDGNLSLKVWIRKLHMFPGVVDFFYFDSIFIRPNSSTNYKGEFHTAQRLTRVSSVTKADKTVAIGDSLSDIYYGTLYKNTGEPTSRWSRVGATIYRPLLRIMAEDALRIAPRPMYFFEGDIVGYVPYLSKVLINNVQGKYQISKYSYNTQSNINITNFREYSTDEITDFRYEFTYDYGNTTKVVINA